MQDNSKPTSSGNTYQQEEKVQLQEQQAEVPSKEVLRPEKESTKPSLKGIRLSETSKTPKVFLDHLLGKYIVSGRSLPEDAVGFYHQVTIWLHQFSESYHFDKEARFEFELEYFNTSSSKCLLDIFKIIARMHKDGKPVKIIWRFDIDDEDMEETGEDYRDLLEVPFILEGVEY